MTFGCNGSVLCDHNGPNAIMEPSVPSETQLEDNVKPQGGGDLARSNVSIGP
jgi:hypothetical protein